MLTLLTSTQVLSPPSPLHRCSHPLHLCTGALTPFSSAQVLTLLTSAQVLTLLTSAQVLSPPSPPHRCCNWKVVAKEIQRPYLLRVPTLRWNLTSCLQSETVSGGRADPLSHLYSGTPLTTTQRCRSNLAGCLGPSEVSGGALEKMEHHHLPDLGNHRGV